MKNHSIIHDPRILLNYGTKFYVPLAMLFVSLLIIVNIIVQKIIYVGGGLLLTAADVIYPLVYILDVIITEVYGYAMSRRVIWGAFFCNIIIVGIIIFAIYLPSNPVWHDQNSFVQILGQEPKFVIASLMAFLTGEFVGSYIIAKMKVFTAGKYLWLRTTSAALIAQVIDCSIFTSIAFYGTLGFHNILLMAFTIHWIKIVYQIIATPGICSFAKFLKKREGVDVYDRHTNFNPLILER